MKSKIHSRLFLSTISLALFASSTAHSQTLYWDGNATQTTNPDGGNGNWDTTLANWDSAPFAGADTVWNNSLHSAFFSSPVGTATLTTGITTRGLTFNVTGYTITGDTLTFGGTNNTVTLNNAVTAATINSAIGTSAANLTLTAQNPLGSHSFILGGAGGWTGSTRVNAGTTLQLNSAGTALLTTSAITLNGGTINQNYGAAAERINDLAPITSFGGTLSTNTPNTAVAITETVGAVTVERGLTTLLHSVSQALLTSQTLTLTSLTRNGTSAVNFASLGSLNTTKNIIVVGGTVATPANEIIGTWATAGNTTQTLDYAVYNGTSQVVPAAIPASAESAWSTVTAPTSNFTLINAASSAVNGRLTATRNINTLRVNTVNTALTSVDIATETITVTGHSFVDGDVVALGSTPPAGLTAGTPYFVVGASGATFQLATTAGGLAINLTSAGTTPNITGGVTLSTGNNLGTTGILSAQTTGLAIAASGSGVVTLPTTTSGTLTVTPGIAQINILAPVTNNGAGVLTLIKNGPATLNLTGTNTFTGGIVVNSGPVVVTPPALNGFVTGAAGGDTINGGSLTYSSANAWGATGRNTTFNGTGTLNSSVAYAGGALTVNADANAAFNASGAGLTYATSTGTGTIINDATLNLGDASAFTGTILSRNITNASPGPSVQFSSLGDGGVLQFTHASTVGNNDSGLRATVVYNGAGTLTFNNRVVQLLERVAGNWEIRENTLSNNSANGGNNWVINTNLLVTGGRAHTAPQSGRQLVLSGSNTDANAFNGVISNGTNANGIGVSKTGAGNWTLTGNNTYTGATSVSGGGILTLSGNNSAMTGSVTVDAGTSNTRLNLNSATAIGTGVLSFSGGGASNTVRLDNTSAGPVNVSTNNAFTLNRDFTFFGTQSLNLGNMTTTLGGLGAGGQRSITVTDKTLTFGGAIGQGLGAVNGITKTGAGTLVLSGNNSYGANTVVSAGMLQLNGNTNGLGFGGNQNNGAIGTTTVSGGAVLDLNGAMGISESITLNGTGIASAGALINTGGAASIVSGVTAINLTTATTGTGYSSPPTVAISGTGTGATAVATMGLTAASIATSLGGSTYTAAPTVAITGGGGTGATATVSLVGAITITNPGTGYTSAPTVTITGGTFTGGTGMTAIANATNFTVSGVQMTAAGSGYTGTPTYTFSGGDAVPGVAASAAMTLAADSSIGGTGNITINSPVAETGGARTLTKVGANTVTLSGVNTYTGATTVSEGTLALSGGSQSSAITAQTGAKLGFTTGSPTTSAAAVTLDPGHSIQVSGPTGSPPYTLMTATSITGTPVLSPAISGRALQIVGGNQLQLISTGGGSAYTTWAGTNAPSGNPDQDFDGDGVSNAVEFALGGLAATKDLNKLPVIATSGPNMTFTFVRDQASLAPAATTTIEVGTTLASWPLVFTVGTNTAGSTAGVTVTQNSPSAGKDTIVLTVVQAPDTKKFARLKVVVVP